MLLESNAIVGEYCRSAYLHPAKLLTQAVSSGRVVSYDC